MSTGYNLSEEIRAGRIQPVQLKESDRETVRALLQRLSEVGVATLQADAPFIAQRLIRGCASAFLALGAKSGKSMRHVIEAPAEFSSFKDFARAAHVLGHRQAIVAVDLASLLAGGVDAMALGKALAALILERSVWTIIVNTHEVTSGAEEVLQRIFEIREDVIEERLRFALHLRQPAQPDRNLFFLLTIADARESMRLLRKSNGEAGAGVDYASESLHALVRALRSDRHEDPDNHTVLGAIALLLFEIGLPLRVGCRHVLTIDALGNRYRLSRQYTVHGLGPLT